MKSDKIIIRPRTAILSAAIVSVAATTGILLHALAGTAVAQPLNAPPHHVTPWTPLRVPELRGAAPTWAPSLSLSSTRWTALGPAPLGALYPFSGRITGIAVHPARPDVIYVAAAGGGVWKTTNGGRSWVPMTDRKRTLSMGAIAMGVRRRDRNDGEDRYKSGDKERTIVYAGTGEANYSADSNFGRGILVSTDGGATWTLFTGPSNAFDRLTTSQVAVDPTDARVAYAAMSDQGNNALCCSNADAGIWKTTDGGQTWTNTTTFDSTDPWSAVVIDPQNPQTLYAAIGLFFGAAANGVYKSTDGGDSWTLLTGGPTGVAAGRIAIAVAPSNPNVLYVIASGTGPEQGSTIYGTLYRIMRSDDGGNTFTDLTDGTPDFMQGRAGMTPT